MNEPTTAPEDTPITLAELDAVIAECDRADPEECFLSNQGAAFVLRRLRATIRAASEPVSER